MQRFHKHLGWAVLASELSHVFCCVIPTIVTILSAFANIGLFVVSPDGFLMIIHNQIHMYEAAIIVFSGAMVALGWVALLLTRKVDCHDTGCVHGDCVPQKSSNSKILIIATLLFIVNMAIYFGIHRNVFELEMFQSHPSTEAQEEHHHHH